MRQVDLSSLRSSVQLRYDLPAFSTTTKPTTAQVNTLINQSVQRLAALLISSFGDDYFTTTASTPTVANTSTTTLPSDFYKLRSLIWLRSTDDPVEIKRASLNDYEQDSLLAARTWSDTWPTYRFQGASTVRWLPTPNAVYTVTCTYVQTPAILSSDGDDVDVGPGWEEWIVQDVCVRIAQTFEEDPSVYIAERNDCERRIALQAPQRDPYAPRQIRDVMWSRPRHRCHDLLRYR